MAECQVSNGAASLPSQASTFDFTALGRSLRREHGFESLRVEGQLPTALRGTLIRNGPGLFESAGKPYDHPFEADGALCAVRLANGTASGAHRVIQSAGLVQERRCGRPLFGSVASYPRRLWNGLRLSGKNTANTHVLVHDKRLFALMEAGLPTEIDPESLDTIGETDFDGVIQRAFSAHPHFVAARNTTYNFGVVYGKQTTLEIYALNQSLKKLVTVPLQRAVMLHDFIATEKHLVFFVAPVRVRLAAYLFGLTGMADLFRWHPQDGTEVVVVPIDRPSQYRRFCVDAFFQWHFANAFESASGEVCVDFVRYPDFSTFEQLRIAGSDIHGGSLCRARIDLGAKQLACETICEGLGEFPRINPRFCGSDYRHVWMVQTESNTHKIVAVDVRSGQRRCWNLKAHERASEPVFVPAGKQAAEGEGWLLTLVYDALSECSYLAVCDAAKLSDGPCARIWFDHHVPQSFHGAWLAQPSQS